MIPVILSAVMMSAHAAFGLVTLKAGLPASVAAHAVYNFAVTAVLR